MPLWNWAHSDGSRLLKPLTRPNIAGGARCACNCPQANKGSIVRVQDMIHKSRRIGKAILDDICVHAMAKTIVLGVQLWVCQLYALWIQGARNRLRLAKLPLIAHDWDHYSLHSLTQYIVAATGERRRVFERTRHSAAVSPIKLDRFQGDVTRRNR